MTSHPTASPTASPSKSCTSTRSLPFSYRTGSGVCSGGGAFWLQRPCGGPDPQRSSPFGALERDGIFEPKFQDLNSYSLRFMLDPVPKAYARARRAKTVVLLVGQQKRNIAHFIRDVFWLYGAARDLPPSELKAAAVECTKYCRWGKLNAFNQFFLDLAMNATGLRRWRPAKALPGKGACVEAVYQKRFWSLSAPRGHAHRFRRLAYERCGKSAEPAAAGARPAVLLLQHGHKRTIAGASLAALAARFESELGLAAPVVRMGTLSPCEQVRAAAGAVGIVSVHGADMSNLVWLPAGSTVVEIVSSDDPSTGATACKPPSKHKWREGHSPRDGRAFKLAKQRMTKRCDIPTPRTPAQDPGYFHFFCATLRLAYRRERLDAGDPRLTLKQWAKATDIELSAALVKRIVGHFGANATAPT